MEDEAFIDLVGARLAALPHVEAVTLGGSRAEGTHRPDSDWDFSLFYRGDFDPQSLRDVGWPGEVAELGGWAAVERTVFNGGAWLEVDGRRTDVHYRDLDVLDRVLAETAEGRFTTEPLWFHLAPVPSYLLLAELASRRVLAGHLPDAPYPERLRRAAPAVWWQQAAAELDHARRSCAPAGGLTRCVGLLARAATCAAHGVLAAQGRWVTNEKQLLGRAGLGRVDQLLAAADPAPDALRRLADEVEHVCLAALRDAGADLEA